MPSLFGILIFSICVSNLFHCDDNVPDVSALRFVHALWRHGDRAPQYSLLNSPRIWPEGLGELTTTGMQQQYELGSYLRKRYVDSGFLSKSYNSSEIYIYSTDYNRTLASALSNLAGMYPPSVDNEFKDGLIWRPIPVHTKPVMEDPVVWADRPCPKTVEIFFNEIMQSPQIKQVEQENQELLNFLQSITGIKFDDQNWLINLKTVYDELFCERANNHTWAPWMTQEIFEKIRVLSNFYFTYYAQDPRVSRLKGGVLFGEIASRFEQKALQPSNLKYFAYSAHDTTMIPQLEIYGAYDDVVPPYASVFLYEMHEKTPGNFSIEVFYKKRDELPSRISIKGCEGEICPLEKFVAIAKDLNITLSDYYLQCGLKQPNQ